MFGENERRFVESIVEHIPNVAKVQQYIKENYNIDSYYDEDNETLHLVAPSINESMGLASAKEYVNSTIDETMLNVVFGL